MQHATLCLCQMVGGQSRSKLGQNGGHTSEAAQPNQHGAGTNVFILIILIIALVIITILFMIIDTTTALSYPWHPYHHHCYHQLNMTK